MIYLDSAATTLLKPWDVSLASARAMRTAASVGRGGHAPARLASEIVFAARERAARLFGVAEPERVIFTMNATHALNIAIRSYDVAKRRVVVSGYEHNSVIRPLTQAGAEIVRASGPLFDTKANLAAFAAALNPDTALAVVNHVSNVFGFVLPVADIAALCARRGIPLVIDASQSSGVCNIDLETLGADYIAMPGHKSLYGPQGTGLLLVGAGAPVRPLLTGGTGSQSRLAVMPEFLPDALEAGTHNVTGIAGLSEGLRFVAGRGAGAILEHERRLARAAAGMLSAVPGVICYASVDSACQTGVLSFVVSGVDCETVAERLAQKGIAVRAGLHCAPDAHISAGTGETGTVRASFCAFNTENDALALAEAVSDL